MPSAPSAPSSRSSDSKSFVARTPAIAMSDLKSGSSSKGSQKASKESAERPQLSGKSESDPAVSNAMTRSFSESNASSSAATGNFGTGKSFSQSLRQETTREVDDDDDDDDDDDNYVNDDEVRKPAIQKRHSSHSYTNVHTQCGRHSDQWLVQPIIDGAKHLFGSSSKKN